MEVKYIEDIETYFSVYSLSARAGRWETTILIYVNVIQVEIE